MHLKENKLKSVNAKIHKMFSERGGGESIAPCRRETEKCPGSCVLYKNIYFQESKQNRNKKKLTKDKR